MCSWCEGKYVSDLSDLQQEEIIRPQNHFLYLLRETGTVVNGYVYEWQTRQKVGGSIP